MDVSILATLLDRKKSTHLLNVNILKALGSFITFNFCQKNIFFAPPNRVWSQFAFFQVTQFFAQNASPRKVFFVGMKNISVLS